MNVSPVSAALLHGLPVTTPTSQVHVERPGEMRAITKAGEFTGGFLVNCAGLQSDQVTRMSAGAAPAQIIPFRGEYFELKPERMNTNLSAMAAIFGNNSPISMPLTLVLIGWNSPRISDEAHYIAVRQSPLANAERR